MISFISQEKPWILQGYPTKCYHRNHFAFGDELCVILQVYC